MTEYFPDRWVIIEIATPDEIIQKVLASWYGGYTGCDSWRTSSGIIKVEKVKDHYIFHNTSGSTYECFKYRYGMSTYTASVYQDVGKKLPKGTTIKIVEGYDYER